MHKDLTRFIKTGLEILFVGLILTLIGCSAQSSLFIHDITNLRRSQQMANVDTGKPNTKRCPFLSFSYQYALVEPEPQVYNDTMIDNTNTVYVNSNLFETRHTLNAEMTYPFSEHVASGILVDMSCGNIKQQNINHSSPLYKDIFEMALYLRFTASLKKLIIGYRPELLLYTVNGTNTIITENEITTRKNFNHLGITYRHSVFFRYTFLERLAFFAGAQHKRQPYARYDAELKFENAYGIYTGLGFKLPWNIALDPYIAIPITTDLTSYRSPVQIGLKCVIDLIR